MSCVGICIKAFSRFHAKLTLCKLFFQNRGTFDAHARDINEEMKMAAAGALAGLISEDELSADYIIPKAFDPKVGSAVAKAVAEAARASGAAR